MICSRCASESLRVSVDELCMCAEYRQKSYLVGYETRILLICKPPRRKAREGQRGARLDAWSNLLLLTINHNGAFTRSSPCGRRAPCAQLAAVGVF